MNPPDPDLNDLRNGAPGSESMHASGPLDGGDRWLRSVVENSSEIIKVLDPDGTLRYASPAFERVLGYDIEEALGTNVLDHVHPDDLARVLEETEKALSAGGVATNVVEYRFRHADGSWRWMEGAGTYLPDDPVVRGVVVNARDVTGRKEAERRLQKAEERYRTLVERMPMISYMQEPEEPSRTTYLSPQYERILGYTPEEALEDQDHWVKIMHPEDRDRVVAEAGRSPERSPLRSTGCSAGTGPRCGCATNR